MFKLLFFAIPSLGAGAWLVKTPFENIAKAATKGIALELLFFVIGLVLMLFGGLFIFAGYSAFVDSPSNHEVSRMSSFLGAFFIGVLPFVAGTWLAIRPFIKKPPAEVKEP